MLGGILEAGVQRVQQLQNNHGVEAMPPTAAVARNQAREPDRRPGKIRNVRWCAIARARDAGDC